ncbi:MAG TPA: hypothetical protein VJ696_03095 [Rhodanobacteraceae bacterium]|nr:hypothetical protein [Rhodanobacteraceae bacterium]
MRESIRIVALIAGFAIAPLACAGVIADAKGTDAGTQRGVWLAWGGQTRLHFNPDALARFGIRIAGTPGASARVEGVAGRNYEVETFPVEAAGALEINHSGRTIEGVGGGALRHAGGPLLDIAGGRIDLRGFSVQANVPSRIGLAIVDAEGTTWFTADHAHPGFDEKHPGIFTMRDMNLRLSRAFAERLGDPSLEGYEIGGLDFRANADDDGAMSPTGGICSYTWPAPGLVTDIQLVYRNGDENWDGHDDSVQVQRCSLTPETGQAPCTASSTTGGVVIDQDSSLRNSGETAVTWHYMMSGDFPPYNNDQHPFLIWNLYRVDADGRIKQIGVSGLKHAFETVNWNCPCNNDDRVIFPTCEDTYAVWNNDTTGVLGPRSELIPSTGIWGRCESVFDTDCNADEDDGGIPNSLYAFRMVVNESDMLEPAATGARYFFEYWYIVRDDQNIYNTMGYREILPHKNGASWSVDLVDNSPPGANFREGPLLNLWVDPAAPPAGADNQELETHLGRARVALKTTDLGDGTWRYEYAVMNFDYSHPQVDPAHPDEPNLKLDSNHGFASFSVPVADGVSVSGLRFDDADLDGGNDWSASTSGGNVTWTAPTGANSLDWGTMYHFEFVADAPPTGTGNVHLVGVATDSEPEVPYDLPIRVPAAPDNDTIFRSGFE